MFARPTAELRDELLALNGVGPETADSILLYAGNHPVFVVDAYTRRILERHQYGFQRRDSYEEIRQLFERALRRNTATQASLDWGNRCAVSGRQARVIRPLRMSTAPGPRWCRCSMKCTD